MIRKNLQKHDFLNGGPVRQYTIPFIHATSDFTNFVISTDVFTTVEPTITLVDNGENIFSVTRNEISWNNSTLVTEDRVREIVEEMLRGE